MIKKSPNTKLYERADGLMQSFRESVRAAQKSARDAGVPVSIVMDGKRYLAMPNGEMVVDGEQSGG